MKIEPELKAGMQQISTYIDAIFEDTQNDLERNQRITAYLIACLNDLNTHWIEQVKSLKFPEFQLKTSEQLNARIDKLLEEGEKTWRCKATNECLRLINDS